MNSNKSCRSQNLKRSACDEEMEVDPEKSTQELASSSLSPPKKHCEVQEPSRDTSTTCATSSSSQNPNDEIRKTLNFPLPEMEGKACLLKVGSISYIFQDR